MSRTGLNFFRTNLLLGDCRLWLTLAFAIFSFSPHFHFVSHTHHGGESGHFHNDLSRHDLSLERDLLGKNLVEVGPENLSGLFSKTQNSDEANTLIPLLQLGKNTWSPKTNPHWHTQNDINALALIHDFACIKIQVISQPSLILLTPNMPDKALVSASARAPPGLG